MKKRFLILTAFLILSSFALPVIAAPLESLAPQGGASGARATGVVQAVTNSGGTPEQANAIIESVTATEQAGIDDAMPPGGLTRGLSELVGGILHIVTWILLKIVTIFLYFIGMFFTFIVEQLVVNMGHFVTSSDAVGIQIAWRIMRDLANLAIIGGLIATAIGAILQLANMKPEKLLVRLIIAALLVNFSFFFAGAVIDSSNFLATTIYKATIQTEHCGESCNIVDRFNKVIRTYNHNILEYLELTKVDAGDIPADSQWMAVLQNLLSIVLMSVTVFVFLSATALLLGRFVALILILITSPIGIAGMVIPQISKYAKEWWEALFSQAFFAPVYFLLVGFSLTILDNSNGAFSGNDTNLIGGLLTFMVATVFMLQSLKIAKGMSEAAKRLGDVYKASDKVAGWMPKAYTGGLKFGGAFVARNTAGWAGDKFAPIYREFAARHRLDQKWWSAPADRLIQDRLGKLKEKKFFGFEGYGAIKEKRKGREVELGEVEKDEKQKAELLGKLTPAEKKALRALKKKLATGVLTPKEQEELDELKQKDVKSLTASEAARLATLGAKLSVGEKQQLDELSERKREGGALGKVNRLEKAYLEEYAAGNDRNKVSQARLEELRGKEKTGSLLAHERAELQHLDILKQKGVLGKDARLETWGEYWDRQLLRGDLGRKKLTAKEQELERQVLKAKVADGTITDAEKTRLAELENPTADGSFGEDKWAYHERLDAAKIDGKNSYRNARSDAESIYASISDGFWEREYDKNPKSIIQLAKILPKGQWIDLQKNPKIRRDIKNDMMRERFGTWARQVREVQNKVDSGEWLLGGEAYNAATLALFNDQTKNIPTSEEMRGLTLSDAVFDEKSGERFQDLRKLSVFPNVFSSSIFADIKDNKDLPKTEQRDFGSTKRKGLDMVRDQYAGGLMLFGLQSKDHMPFEDGTANYHGAERAVKDARAVLSAESSTSKVLARAALDPNSVSQSDLQLAQANKRYAEMVLKADKDGYSPFKARADKKIGAIKEEEYARYAAEGITREELHDAKRLEVMTEARQEYEKAKRDGTLDLSDDATFATHKLLENEQKTRDYYRGKNPREIKAIFNKRSWWSANTPIGINVDQLQSLEGQDIGERDEFFAQMLIRGDDSMIANYATNEHLKSLFGWPSPERIKKINLWRRSMGKAELPPIFSEEGITESLKGGGSEINPEDDGGDNSGGTSGESPRRPSGGSNPGGQIAESQSATTTTDATASSEIRDVEFEDIQTPDETSTFTERQAAAAAATRTTGSAIEPGGSGDDFPEPSAPEIVAPTITDTGTQATPSTTPQATQLSPEDYFKNFDRGNPYSENNVSQARAYLDNLTDDQIISLPSRVVPLALPGIKRPSTVLALLNRYKNDKDALTGIRGGFTFLYNQNKLSGEMANMVRSWQNPA